MIEIIAVISKGQWRPGIGDPTILGWATTIAYLIAAGLCGAYALRARRISPSVRFNGHRFFWWSLAVFMLLMGFNKQLDLQVLVLHIARKMSVEQGWFAERDTVRKWILLSFGFTCSVFFVWVGWRCRRVWRRYILAVSGIVLLILFVLVRASGHRLVILGYHPGRLPVYDVLEVAGIVCVGVSAWMELHRSKQKTESNPPTSDF